MGRETPEAVDITAKIVMDLLQGRRLTIRGVMEDHDRSYQQARRYLLGLTETLPIDVERDGREKVFRLRPRSVPVNPDVIMEDTGQLPLFGTEHDDEGE